MQISRRQLTILSICLLVIGIAALVVNYVLPNAQLVITSNVADTSLELNGKTYTINGSSTIRLRAGNYAYLATKSGFSTQKGFVSVTTKSPAKLDIKLQELTVFEREYGDFHKQFPNTKVVEEVSPQPNWMIVTLQSIPITNDFTNLLMQKSDSQWKIVLQSKTGFTAAEITQLPPDIQKWLIDNEYTEEGDPPA